MNELESSIQGFNYVFSVPIFANNDSDYCISLYDLIISFNHMYREFKKEYDAIRLIVDKEKKQEDMVFYLDIINETKKERGLQLGLFVDKDYFCRMTFYEFEGDMEISKLVYEYYDESCQRKKIKIDSEIGKKYLDLFEKYELLIRLYDRFMSDTLYKDECNKLETFVHPYNNIAYINDFTFEMAWLFCGVEDSIKIKLKLGEEIDINLDDSKINLNGHIVEASKDDYISILKAVHINSQRLIDRKV